MRKFIGYAGILLLILVLLGQVMSKEFHLSKSIIVKSRPTDIYYHVNDLKKWPKWASWVNLSQDNIVHYGDLTQGIGASMRWKSKDGSGRINITAAAPETGVAFDVYIRPVSSPSISAIEYKIIDEQFTKISWHIQGEVDISVVGSYATLYIKYRVATEMEKSLEKLKRTIDKTSHKVKVLPRSNQEFAMPAYHRGNNKFYLLGTVV